MSNKSKFDLRAKKAFRMEEIEIESPTIRHYEHVRVMEVQNSAAIAEYSGEIKLVESKMFNSAAQAITWIEEKYESADFKFQNETVTVSTDGSIIGFAARLNDKWEATRYI